MCQQKISDNTMIGQLYKVMDYAKRSLSALCFWCNLLVLQLVHDLMIVRSQMGREGSGIRVMGRIKATKQSTLQARHCEERSEPGSRGTIPIGGTVPRPAGSPV